jgi:hypothetical protein
VAAIKNPTDALTVLMAAALALPGMAAAASDPNVRNDRIVLSYNHAAYREDHRRMDVDVDQLSITVPIADHFEVRLNTLRDITSGASPFANRLVNGKPVMVLSTAASIREQRNVVDVTGAYYGSEFYGDINVGKSVENDYVAKFLSANYRHAFNDKATTVSVGASYSDDTVWEKYYPRVAGATPSVYRGRHKHDLIVGVSQILDANSVAQLSLSHGYSYGHLNDQYRRVMVLRGAVPTFQGDTRPGDHTQWIALARFSHYFAGIRSALHLDYRVAKDSWAADSHTADAKLRTELGNGWTIAPGLRYYTQKSADFYGLSFTQMPADKLASSDYRLAAFGAISPKLEVVKSFRNGLAFRLSYESYMRKYDYRAQAGRGDSLDDYKARLISMSVEGAF